MMKITIEATENIAQSPLGAGRVWTGETDLGTPVRALVSGMQPGNDDPETVKRFQAEYGAISRPICPDCGEPLDEHEHELVEEHKLIGSVTIDLNEVIAAWIMAYGESRVEMPKGATREDLARCLGSAVRETDPDYYKALTQAAGAVTQFVLQKLLEANGILRRDGLDEVQGNA